MSYAVAALAVLSILLAALVTGLLRSHAEILRRLEEIDPQGERSPDAARASDRLAPGLPGLAGSELPQALDIEGDMLDGDVVSIAFRPGASNTLLAFLSSSCLTCQDFWTTLAAPGPLPGLPADTNVIVVTKSRNEESPSRLAALAPGRIPLVMSSRAWGDYGVTGSPYFVFVDGRFGRVNGEGSALAWQQVMSLLTDALADIALNVTQAGRRPSRRRVETPAELWDRGEKTLLEHGIGPGHPSLYSLASQPSDESSEQPAAAREARR